jgi:hypothetical protein
MGTRSLTFVYSESKSGEKATPIMNMYRQYDGYPSGHGAELAEFLSGGRLVNGLSGMGKEKQFNGMGCLAAQMVANFKDGAGSFYLYPVTTTDCGQDYEYHILNIDGQFKIYVYYCGCNLFGMSSDYESEVVFSGSLPEFIDFCNVTEDA